MTNENEMAPVEIENGFKALGLPNALVRTLESAGFTHPTPIQEQAIPAQLNGQDIMGIAQTGSGKTAAFSLPILTHLLAREGKRTPKTVGALILAPTRELAVQIEDMVRMYTARGHITTALVLGGVSRQKQIIKLARGVDILVATPGRLEDLMRDRKVRLDETKYLVIDEADRMLDMGFIKPVRDIAAACAKPRQTALFSATMAPEVAKLAAGLLNDPVRVEAAPQATTVTKIEQRVILVPTKLKRDKLNELLGDESLSRVILFCRTKHGSDKVAKNLAKDGFTVAAIHGNKSQNARQNALNGFKKGKVRILVATDIAARGIDVPNISHVINWDLPDEAENYVHRIGRTGRNGASGIAISMVDGGERGKLRDIERLIHTKLSTSGELPPGDYPEASKGGNGRSKGQRGHRGGGQNSQRRAGGKGRPQFSRRPEGEERQGRGERAQATEQARPIRASTEGGYDPASAGPGAAKPAKSKKPRWNKRQKDSAKTAKRNAERSIEHRHSEGEFRAS